MQHVGNRLLQGLSVVPEPRLQRCACGAACGKCSGEEEEGGRIQTKLTVGAPGDRYEEEADRVAEQISRMTDPSVQGQASTEEEPEEETLRTKPRAPRVTPLAERSGSGGPAGVLPSEVHRALGSPGRSLSPATRAYMEPRFGADFGGVRVHTGPGAERAAARLHARAFTYGRHIWLGRGETESDRRLMAHELTHVAQQASPQGRSIRRKMVIENPGTALPGAPPRKHWEEIRDSLRTLSSEFTANSAGKVAPRKADTCKAPARQTDQCLCDLHNDGGKPWKIKIDDAEWPHTQEANKRVVVQSTRSGIDLGAWGTGAPGGQRIFMDQWRVLGHELCGHAWLMVSGTHPATRLSTRGRRVMGRPSHDPTVRVENVVATEVAGAGAPQRGLFADPHSGESFGRVTVAEFPSGSARIASLPAAMRARVDVIERFMTRTGLLRADIIGHADHVGPPAGNRRLSRRRAQALRNELVRRGIRGFRFNVVTGRGSSECPAAPADNAACRKVEIFMYIFESASERFP